MQTLIGTLRTYVLQQDKTDMTSEMIKILIETEFPMLSKRDQEIVLKTGAKLEFENERGMQVNALLIRAKS